MSLYEPNHDDLTRLAEMWRAVQVLVEESYPGQSLDQSLGDLDVLQQILDDQIIERDDRGSLQCLGVAFGRVLARQVERLDWSIIEDEYGRDPTIRYRETTLTFNVLTMISKRIERGEQVDVRSLFDWVLSELRRLEGSVD